MIENYNQLLLVSGIAFAIGAFAPYLLKRVPISLPILQVTFGLLMGYFWTTLDFLSPIESGTVIEKLCELVVLVSLVGAGLKIDTPFKYSYWRPTLRLLLITMPICIAVMAVLGYYVFSFSLAVSILLGAALAPTDPVLASSIQVGPPNSTNEDVSRFALTSEAGLNDGLAFPFVYLAILIAENYGKTTGFSWQLFGEWLSFYVLWKIIAGVIIGVIVGKLFAKLVFAEKIKHIKMSQGYVIISLMLLSYGFAELIQAYGFIAVFVAAAAFRRGEIGHDYHRELHQFSEQSEGLLMSLVLIFFGIALGQAFNSDVDLSWQVYAISILFLFVIRPIVGWISLSGLKISKSDRIIISSLGIRGIGSFYYLSYALNKDVFSNHDATDLWFITGTIVLISIFIHGISAPILMNKMKAN